MLAARKQVIQFAIILIAFVFAAKLFFLQVVSDDYILAAQNNAVQRVVEHPLRGMIFDRNGKLIVANTPVFDLMFVPFEFKLKDTLKFCRDFDMTKEELLYKLSKAKSSPYKPSLLVKHLTTESFAQVQDKLSEYPGIYVEARTVREYPHHNMANALGYVKEVDKKTLEKDTAGYYQQGDQIGKTGIESTYEKELRGRRGTRYVMVNVKRIVKGSFKNGQYDTLPIVGENLYSAVDLELQQYGEHLMQNKIGSIVAIEPATGEILSLVSTPSYDPNLLTGSGKQVSNNFYRLVTDHYKPLFNRPIMALYPPGSIIKIVQALIAMQEGVIDPNETRIPCTQDVVKCHGHPSPLDIRGSIQHSCNPFYYRTFNRIIKQGKSADAIEDTRIGLQRWNEYMKSFGLGQRLGSDLHNEKGGNIPSVAYYDKKFKNDKWRFGNIYSLSIGQGEMGVVPLQMANLAAIMANRGFYYTPHVIKGIGEAGKLDPKFTTRHQININKEYFDIVIDGMEAVVKSGTARKAYIKDIPVCGKTGTAQNPHGEDHSIFIAFAPKENPKIAIAVYVENAGFGGTWAAPIASLMIEKYIKRKIEGEKRLKMEQEVINKDLMHPKKKIPLEKKENNGTQVPTGNVILTEGKQEKQTGEAAANAAAPAGGGQ